jgi:hypothetical protein
MPLDWGRGSLNGIRDNRTPYPSLVSWLSCRGAGMSQPFLPRAKCHNGIDRTTTVLAARRWFPTLCTEPYYFWMIDLGTTDVFCWLNDSCERKVSSHVRQASILCRRACLLVVTEPLAGFYANQVDRPSPRAVYPHTLAWSFHFMPAVLQSCLVSGWGPV